MLVFTSKMLARWQAKSLRLLRQMQHTKTLTSLQNDDIPAHDCLLPQTVSAVRALTLDQRILKNMKVATCGDPTPGLVLLPCICSAKHVRPPGDAQLLASLLNLLLCGLEFCCSLSILGAGLLVMPEEAQSLHSAHSQLSTALEKHAAVLKIVSNEWQLTRCISEEQQLALHNIRTGLAGLAYGSGVSGML